MNWPQAIWCSTAVWCVYSNLSMTTSLIIIMLIGLHCKNFKGFVCIAEQIKRSQHARGIHEPGPAWLEFTAKSAGAPFAAAASSLQVHAVKFSRQWAESPTFPRIGRQCLRCWATRYEHTHLAFDRTDAKMLTSPIKAEVLTLLRIGRRWLSCWAMCQGL